MARNLMSDPRVLGQRLTEARKARGMTQEAAAEVLGLSRPTFIAIEKGERAVRSEELVRLAELYGRSLHELQRRRPPVRDFVRHFRSAMPEEADADGELLAAVALLQSLADHYLELEEVCGAPLARNYPAPYPIAHLDATTAANEVADRERCRLGLGDGPLPELRELLEGDVGLRIFCLALPARVSGLFLFTEELGPCIAVQRLHPAGRLRWSLCHEFAHFLVDRYEPEVTVLRSGRTSRKERFADQFAGSFLMPESGLRRRFHDQLRAAGQVTPGSLLRLAELYGVSFEAMVLRCEDLRLIPVGKWQQLRDRGFRVAEARAPLGLDEAREEPELPKRYVELAVRAYEEGLLTEGQLVDILHTDRVEVRRIVESARTRPEVTFEGESGQFTLDLGFPLVAVRAR